VTLDELVERKLGAGTSATEPAFGCRTLFHLLFFVGPGGFEPPTS
jgi:hypothetical protein